MKKTIKTLAGFICALAIFLGCAGKPDGSVCLPWTLGCLAVALITGLAFNKLHKIKQ